MFFRTVGNDVQLGLLTEVQAGALFALTDACRNHLRPWLPWVDETRTVEDTKAFIRRSLQQFADNNGFQAGIWYRGELAGVIGFHYLDWTNRRTEIGYWLAEHLQGRGIMTMACREMVDIALRDYGLHRVEIRVAAENRKSRAIPERLGFVQEGVLRQAAWLYDRYVDVIVYSMLKRDWEMVSPQEVER
ncbi:50S ribosomal protein L7 serine acetyltransferase [Alicyclobacillus cellulosilyticus]|uniref:50S ribosomal protein L7 serine acetyltransferase n=1 Tax=Alicyclobacillus cellulosilyticus TaxID=1003997 RepID=A0A917K5D1_9BACL|nr:GNAT family protein [Alicyclobacillus cellulosilyticus]GGJ01626.1 50S ribosomal protein L7 serine acetyltransferase [Alicyclobacillus cellulosilyticus]